MKTFKTNFLFLLVICLLLTACRANRQVVKTNDTTTTQKTESKISYKDTVFFTKQSETNLALPISVLGKCSETIINQGLNNISNTSKPQVWTQKNGNATATIKVIKDSIYFFAKCDSLAMAAKIKQVYYKDYLNTVSLNDQIIEEKTKLNWWKIIGFIVIAFVAGFITNSLIKISI